jgi:predicted nucleic acid-binding protein
VVDWLGAVAEETAFLSVITLGEIRRGVDRLEEGRRRTLLDEWLTDDLPTRFEGRILPVDHDVADGWGALLARTARRGVSMSVADALVAATAQVHGLALATRNVGDFLHVGVELVNPWDD